MWTNRNVVAAAAAAAIALGTSAFAGGAGKKDIVDTAVGAGKFNTLATALKAAGLVDTLKGPGPFTVFAPTDEAFAKLPAGTVETLLKPENKAKLTAILTYHVLPVSADAKTVTTSRFLTTVNGLRVAVTTDGGAKVDNATITATDIAASNGIIHVIDSVILPSEDSIAAVATKAGSFTTLLTALKATGLDAAVAGPGNFTVFAPTDAAFAKLPAGTLESLLKPENKEQLATILKYHVLDTAVFSTDVGPTQDVATLAGSKIAVKAGKGGVTINESTVTAADLRASNGVIHVIDTVLLPPAKKEVSAAGDSAREVIDLAIGRGSKLYNEGHHEACAAIYEVAAASLVSGGDRMMPRAARKSLEKSLSAARHEHNMGERAWILRRGLDAAAEQM